MKTLAWFQCLAGASGDMLLGALVGAGAPLEAVQAAVDAVGVEKVSFTAAPVTRAGVAATKVEVRAERSSVVRTWAGVRALLEEADLADPVRARALDAFARLARAEAAAHRTRPEHVHFHEVGALDAIADVVGTCAALHALGVDSAVCSPVTLGSGMTRSEHGPLPVPGPAVLALLAEAGAPVHTGEVPYELCTPTGAALLAATVTRWGGLPPVRVTATGIGAGARELEQVPNVLRVVVGQPVGRDEAATPDMLLLEANVDDLDPRLWPDVLGRLLRSGAADAWLTPILMKKGRPAHTLSVLTEEARVDAVRRVVFTETSTLGVRETRVGRTVLDRAEHTVTVDRCEIRVKVAFLDGAVVNAQPEYDDVARAAATLGRSAKSVLAAATAAAHAAALTP